MNSLGFLSLFVFFVFGEWVRGCFLCQRNKEKEVRERKGKEEGN